MNRPVLFLDLDGVLNRIISDFNFVTGSKYEPRHPGVDSRMVTRVYALCEGADLDVVVSSSWRENYNLVRLRQLVGQTMPHIDYAQKLAARIVGTTPIYERIPKKLYLRNKEIHDWLAAHRPDAAYVIIDDAARHNFPADRFVHVDGKRGFQYEDLDRAVAILAAQGIKYVEQELKT